jgi:hypothetical protein
LRANNTKLMQKTDWKKVGYFRSYGRKTIFDQPLGQVAPSRAKMKKLLSQFFFIFNTSKMQKKFWEKLIRTKVTADWKLVAILNFRRHFESEKKLFFCDLCGIWLLTKIKRENTKFFNIDWVMIKKLNFRGHFEQSRHFETKLNSTFLKTGGYSPYIEVNFCKIWRKSKMYFFRYKRVC